MSIIFFISLILLSVLLYIILLPATRNAASNSYVRYLGETLFTSFLRSYERISAGSLRLYNTFADKNLNNILGLIGTAICTIGMFVLIIIDISFITLMGAQFWGSDPEMLALEISEAAQTIVPIAAVTDYFDALLTWGVKHISVHPSANFLTANALVTIICLLITGLFIKETLKPTGWLPLNLQTAGRWFVGSLSTILLLCLVFYYGFLIYYGVFSQNIVELEATEAINYFEDDQNTVSQQSSNSLSSLDDAKLAASVCYAVAVLGVNFLAFWGFLLFAGIIISLSLGAFRSVIELINQWIILPLGLNLGYMQLVNQNQTISINQESQEDIISSVPIDDTSMVIPTNEESSRGNQIEELNELQQLGAEVEEKKAAEDERQKNIYNNPLNLN